MSRPQVSIVIATCNRREDLLHTLDQLQAVTDEADGTEIIVTDNCSSDGTAEAVRASFPDVKLIPMDENKGATAKAWGVEQARGEYVLFLDDDSYPRPGSLGRMLQKFAKDPQLGCANFTAHLRDGRRECSALPNVYIGCGAGFHRQTLLEVGNLDRDMFMLAEEYDLSFRLIQAGWKVRTFRDLRVDHLKSPHSRLNSNAIFYNTRNNLLIAARYLPEPHNYIFRKDWLQRYQWLADRMGEQEAYEKGREEGLNRWAKERETYIGWRLNSAAFEKLFHFAYIHHRMHALATSGIHKIVFADLGKNIYPFFQAAGQMNLEILAIGDDAFARRQRLYRGIPVVPLKTAFLQNPDAAVIANTSPVHAELTANRLIGMTRLPVHLWFDTGFHARQDEHAHAGHFETM